MKRKKDFTYRLDLQFFANDEGGVEADTKTDNVDSNEGTQTNEGTQAGKQDDNKKTSLDDLLKDEELQKQIQSLIDKRVTDAVKKTERKWKQQLEEEKRKAQMTEEERHQEQLKQLEEEQRRKERELRERELKLDLIDILEQEELDTGFRDIIDVSSLLGVEDKEEAVEKLRERVQQVKKLFNDMVNKRVEQFKKEYLKGNTPKNVGKENNNTPLDEYEEARKKGDVKAMLASKFKTLGAKK